MTFALTQEQKMLQDMVREYAQAVIKPLADTLDKASEFPAQTVEQLAEMGIMGLNIPEEYGGSAMDEICKVLAISEIACCCGSTAELLAVHLLVNDIILKNGDEHQKQSYLTAAASGKLGAFALTEAGAGSDASAVMTKAVVDEDEYVINGTKCFISNMGPEEGDFVVVIASTDPPKGIKGLSALLVDRDTPGFSLGKTEDKMGIRAAAVSELVFKDCRVPKANLLGKEGDGFKIAMAGLDGGRIGIAAQAVGLARGALEAAVVYGRQRIQFGKPIALNQGLQWYIADMATRTESAWMLTLAAADARQRKEPTTKLAAMAKYAASEAAVFVCDRALQIHGGYGYMKDYPIERMYRDARITTLYEGTSEVQKIIISKEAMKD